ncbi:MAG: carboxypeptidase-like regulatory domain-containing protein, partial [Bacteroidales bacterium]|nr:carboxypeptidase-like regulatory domain-containing protein [Bacteroidales bacterium]
MSITLMLFASLGWGQYASAQSRAIFGKVVDANGEPIIGAAVMIPGTTTGATTDLDGVFSLRVAPGTSLEVSCIGYVTRRVSAAENMTIILQDDSEMLEETVVV